MPFEKVALLDADMVITRPLDALFQDTNTTHFPVDTNSTKLPAPDLPELPERYALAAFLRTSTTRRTVIISMPA